MKGSSVTRSLKFIVYFFLRADGGNVIFEYSIGRHVLPSEPGRESHGQSMQLLEEIDDDDHQRYAETVRRTGRRLCEEYCRTFAPLLSKE